jgi:transcriptional regulator with XRE-family HTH domain
MTIVHGTETARPRHALLARILSDRSWTQADLARIAGVGDYVVSNLMLCKFRGVSNKSVSAVATACGVHPLDLVPLDENEDRFSIDPIVSDRTEVPFSVLIALGKRIPEPACPTIEDGAALAAFEVHTALRVGALCTEDETVVLGRFGLGRDPAPLTRRELASRLGCSANHVQNMEGRALAQLRFIIMWIRKNELIAARGWQDSLDECRFVLASKLRSNQHQGDSERQPSIQSRPKHGGRPRRTSSAVPAA